VPLVESVLNYKCIETKPFLEHEKYDALVRDYQEDEHNVEDKSGVG
jgi:hypothetical protein